MLETAAVIATYTGREGWTELNLFASIGSFIMTIGFGLLVIDLAVQWMYTYIGGSLQRFLDKPHIRAWFERGVGTVFIALALLVAIAYKQG